MVKGGEDCVLELSLDSCYGGWGYCRDLWFLLGRHSGACKKSDNRVNGGHLFQR